jgi:hypothetical protein
MYVRMLNVRHRGRQLVFWQLGKPCPSHQGRDGVLYVCSEALRRSKIRPAMAPETTIPGARKALYHNAMMVRRRQLYCK